MASCGRPGLPAGATAGRLDKPCKVPQPLMALYRPSVRPYMISWIRYSPAQVLGHGRVPALIVQGTTDIQVTVAEAEALKAARPDAQLAIMEGMNHVLKQVPANAAAQRLRMVTRTCRWHPSCSRHWTGSSGPANDPQRPPLRRI